MKRGKGHSYVRLNRATLLPLARAAVIDEVWMPLGASAIEIKPYEFVGWWPNHYLRKMLTMTDANSSVFWGGLNIGAASNSAPGKEDQDLAPIHI